MPGPGSRGPCARRCPQPPAAALQTGSREQGAVPNSPRSRRVPRAKAGGKAGARAPALLLSHVGLSQGLAPSHPNHLWSGDNEP